MYGAVVTGWLLIICITPQGASKGLCRSTKEYLFINICLTISIQVLNLHDFFIDVDGDFPIIFQTWMKNVILVLAYTSNERMSSEDKTNISYPKANRGCPLSTTNCTLADCVKNVYKDPYFTTSKPGSIIVGFHFNVMEGQTNRWMDG